MGEKSQCAVTGRLVWCRSVDSMLLYVIKIPNFNRSGVVWQYTSIFTTPEFSLKG